MSKIRDVWENGLFTVQVFKAWVSILVDSQKNLYVQFKSKRLVLSSFSIYV